jgi:tRNA G37 N-methylase TrmD
MKFVDDDVRNAHPDSGQGSALLGERRDAFLRVLMGNIEEQNAIRKGLFAIRRWVAIVKYTTPAKAMVRYIPNQAESGH